MEALLSRTTPDAREARCFRAWELHQKGWKQQQIADALGVSQGTVSQWLRRAEAGCAEGFRGSVWTRGRVKEVIRWEFGVAYSPSRVGRLLKRIGWSLQKPLRRARQRDEEKVRAFKEERWPTLKKGDKRETESSLRRPVWPLPATDGGVHLVLWE